MIALLCCLALQDLWRKSASAELPMPRVEPDSRMGPILNRGGGRIEPKKISFDLGVEGGFSCGKFDLDASFGSILRKQVAGDVVGTAVDQLRQQLAASPMVLACQMSPTLCDVMKHFRVTSGDLLQLELEDCRSIERRAGSSAGAAQARSQQQCLADLQASGVPLDEALRRCRGSSDLRGLDGRRRPEVNLVQELEDVFSLAPDSKAIVEELLDAGRLSPRGWRGDVKLRAVDAAYERGRSTYALHLQKASQGEAFAGAWPASLPPLDPADLDLLKSLDDSTRQTAIATLAASFALVDLADLIHGIQALLESAEAMADDAVLREQYARQSARLGRELGRLRDAEQFSSRALATWAAVRSAALETRNERVRSGTAPLRYDAARRREEANLKPWGKYCEDPLCPPGEKKP